MYCRKCGTKLNDNAKFCKNCGEPVNREKVPVSSDNDANEDIIDEISDLDNAPKSTTHKKKKHLFSKIIIVSILLFAIFIGLNAKFHLGIWLPRDEDNITIDSTISDNGTGTVYDVSDGEIEKDELTGITYINDVVIIFFEKNTNIDRIHEVVDSIGGEIVGEIPAVNQYQVRIEARSYSELVALCAELELLDDVKRAYVDQAIKLTDEVIPDDPWKKILFFLGDKWNESKPSGSNWWQEAIGAPSAWEYNEYLSPVNIGIVDDGFDLKHEDLKGVIKKTTSNNDAQRHGTHVAGIIGAVPNNKCGISGVVWNANIYTVDWQLSKKQEKEEQYSGWNTTTEIYNGVVNLIVQDDAKVVNLSLGLVLDKEDETDELVAAHGDMASQYLCSLLDDGYDFLIVQSAGNGDNSGDSIDAKYNGLFCSIDYSNCCDSDITSQDEIINRVVVVGAAQNDGNCKFSQASFSNAGNRVDICAPGKDIYSTVPGGYSSLSGTSMAAPIVTGVAALVWSADNELTGAEVKEIICDPQNTKYAVEDNTSKSHPLTNSYRMINAELSLKKVIDSKSENDIPDLGENPVASDDDLDKEPLHFSGVVLKPEDVVLKMYDALKDGDYETAAECLDPATEQQLDFWGGIASSIVSLFTGEYISWGQLLLEAAGATDVEIIECSTLNLEYDSDFEILSEWIPQVPGLRNIACTEADVKVKYRYTYEGIVRIEKETYHVRRYEWSGWRIEDDVLH